jgi:MFS family permease
MTAGSDMRRWSVVGFGFLALALAFSARATLGLVMPVWDSELGWSRELVSGVAAAGLVAMAAIAPFAGRLVDRRGPRLTLGLGLAAIAAGSLVLTLGSSPVLLVVGYTVLSAIGFGLAATHVVSTATAAEFSRRRGLAIGIATAGATGGQFLIVPAVAAVLAVASWRWAYGALAVACALLALAILRWMADARPQSHASPGPRPTLAQDGRTVLARPAFHILFWSFLLCGFTTSGVIETHFLPYAAACGFPPLPAAGAYGLLSAVNLAGMVAAGWLVDRVSAPLLLAAIYLGRALTFLLLGDVGGDVTALFLFAGLFGAVDYATVPVTAALVARHIGLRVMGLAMGMISAGHSVGAALGAWAGGQLFPSAGGYQLLWSMSFGLALAAAGLAVLLIWHRIHTPQMES